MHRTLVLMGLVISLTGAHAQSFEERVDAYISAWMEKETAPGLSVSIVRGDSVLLSKGYGLADIENDIAATSGTMYRIASISKMLTAAGAMLLVEDGKLDLHAPIQTYCSFPEKPWPVTTHHLLSHQSGIRHHRTFEERENTRHFRRISQSLRSFRDDDLLFEPGTKEEYTTLGYNVVGAVIEGASDMDYVDFMRERVFEPAGMTATRDDDHFAIIPHRAQGYQRAREGGLENAPLLDTSQRLPGGGLISNVGELASFARALMNGRIVKPETLETMWTVKTTKDGEPTRKGYGCNIGIDDGRKVIWHIGGQAKVSTNLYFLPEEKIAVATLCNLQVVDIFKLCTDLARMASEDLK